MNLLLQTTGVGLLCLTLTCSIILQVSSMSNKVFPNCSDIDPEIVAEIRSYQSTVDQIIDYVLNGAEKGKTYSELMHFVNTFGHRMTGSSALENAIDYLIAEAEEEGFDAVTTEDVAVPVWVRNTESAEMLQPRVQSLPMLGLGSSVGTPPEGITAEVIVVTSFDELAALADIAVGKIVVYNQPFESYGQSVEYRNDGASEAAKVGAVGALVRSATDFSIASPHTGVQIYEDGVNKIPVACITQEDAQLIYRLYQSGETVVVRLTMSALNVSDGYSRNTLIDFWGQQWPEQLVVVSGHIDSWDVGTGAMDDAGGSFVGYHASRVLKELGLRPRRTVRTIMFTSEEQGVIGGIEYYQRHQNDSEVYQLMMESDGGTFNPRGLAFSGSDNATCVMKEIVALTGALNTTEIRLGGGSSDTNMWTLKGVPLGTPVVDDEKYLWFHHSAGDTIEVENPDELDRITAFLASVSYVAANISFNLQDI